MIVLNVIGSSLSCEIDDKEEFNKYFISSSKLVSQHVNDDDVIVTIFSIDLSDFHFAIKEMYANQ